jgi:hypothetical protein
MVAIRAYGLDIVQDEKAMRGRWRHGVGIYKLVRAYEGIVQLKILEVSGEPGRGLAMGKNSIC